MLNWLFALGVAALRHAQDKRRPFLHDHRYMRQRRTPSRLCKKDIADSPVALVLEA